MKSITFLFLVLVAWPASSQTKITHYVVETQEKRRELRWTLTEWLKIKERMRMMDLWLALVSDPKKDKFAPELSLSYKQGSRVHSIKSLNDDSSMEFQEQSAAQADLNFWFTNLISSSTGVRTPNIDLGLSFTKRSYTGDSQNSFSQGATVWSIQDSDLQYGLVNFRLFGKNIQDTYLVFKYGQYSLNKGFSVQGQQAQETDGLVGGSEAKFYFLSWLGVDGEYLKYGNSKGPNGGSEGDGLSERVGVFIEIYNLNLGYSRLIEKWTWRSLDESLETRDESHLWHLGLLF